MKYSIKLIALILFLFGLTAILVTDNPAVETAHGFSGGPPGGHTAAPGEWSCAVGWCHGGSLNAGPGRLTITAPSVYEAGKTYQITVQHSTDDPSRLRWGFQLTALTLANNRAGNLQSTSNLTNIINDEGPELSRQYVEHSSEGTFPGQTNQAVWTFEWTAPDEDAGPVIFYAAGNQADGKETRSGDQIYTTTHITISGPPEISGAEVAGKTLIVRGRNFAVGAELFLNGRKQKKTSNDEVDVTSSLLAAKSGKKVKRGQTVILEVVNPDGSRSEQFAFTRPL
ncbi:MAG: choice-of-anchor V domain-containing protein [Acidobacteriota bacterium]